MHYRNSASSVSDRRASFRWSVACAVWSMVIVAATVPWTSFVGHTHWQKVQWIPFRSPPVRVSDIVGNTLLYLPFGYTLLRPTRRLRIWHALVLAGALSISLEWSQLYSHSRFPSVQDVLCNTCGAAVGAWLATRRRAVE